MIEAGTRAQELAAEVTEADMDWRTVAALSWQFSVIGEAARQVSPQTRAKWPEVPWQQAIGLRNPIVHTYWRTDPDVLTQTAGNNLPVMITQLKDILLTLATEDESAQS
jgi:uncharacterized protein with HEPN domain